MPGPSRTRPHRRPHSATRSTSCPVPPPVPPGRGLAMPPAPYPLPEGLDPAPPPRLDRCRASGRAQPAPTMPARPVRVWRNGRRGRLKLCFRKECRFESDHPHQQGPRGQVHPPIALRLAGPCLAAPLHADWPAPRTTAAPKSLPPRTIPNAELKRLRNPLKSLYPSRVRARTPLRAAPSPGLRVGGQSPKPLGSSDPEG